MTLSVFPISRAGREQGIARRAWRLVYPYWRSSEGLVAWTLLLIIVGLMFAQVGMAVVFSNWNRDFYNALEHRDAPLFGKLLIYFLGVAAVSIGVSASRNYMTTLLHIRWRRWLLYNFFDLWVDKSRHYALQQNKSVDNPDQRLTEDISQFVNITLWTSLQFAHTVSNLITFSVILWGVSGSLEVFGITIPGYMFWAAVIYSIIGSILTHLIGRRLIGMNNRQQELEADIRYDMMRVREYSENVALQRGEPGEKTKFRQRFLRVWDNFHSIARSEIRLAFFVGGYTQFSFLFPFAIGAPRLFSGGLQFGELMQLTQAFSSVQDSLSWFIAVYNKLVDWRAVTDRLLEFDQALADVIATPRPIERVCSSTGSLELNELEILRPDGKSLISIPSLLVSPGQHVLIQGPSGCGKSTLIRALAGLWQYGSGQVRLPEELYVIPQRPYFPVGTLKQAMLYPEATKNIPDEMFHQVLHACRLEHLQEDLEQEGHWEKRLSPGEQQRLAIARALLAKPDWLLLDEVSSALSQADEELVYRLIRQHLPACTVISVGHRASLSNHHDTLWQIGPKGEVVQTFISAAAASR